MSELDVHKTTAAESALVMVAALADALGRAEQGFRDDEDDALHSLRTIVRRLRSVLASTRRLFAEGATDDVRERLGRFGSVLGTARDLEVSADRAEALLNELPPELSDDDARSRLVDAVRAQFAEASERVVAYLDSDHYTRLLDALGHFLIHADATDRGRRSPGREFRRISRRERRRVRTRADAVTGSSALEADAPAQFARLHELRKSARRLRYFLEAVIAEVSPAAGSRFEEHADAAERIQDVIGDYRDASLFGESLLFEANRANGANEKTVVYGVLYERAQLAAEEKLAQVRDALADMR